MKYQVLARKYRPRSFTSMVGQEHVLKALTNALDTERLHHAYLFTGTRGVGKTTVARVLAKALNCERGITASPCGECPACTEIDEGRFVDLLEVDAASRTKVEDTRELLENVQYAPTRGRFKIYLIDEVHMLSGHSFNALLKTLEEPPPHVKFLLATTDPQKLPVTILSRCLQFNLKRLTIRQIEQQLQQILAAEQLESEPAALKPLAIAADGSMRDALSLLDQAIAYSGGKLNLDDIEAMLGSVQKERVFEILSALANADGRSLIEQSRMMTEQGLDVTTLLAEIITLLQRIALYQQIPEAIDDSLGDETAIKGMAQLMTAEDVQLYYQIALNGRKDLAYSPQPQGGFEMILLRMLAFRPVNASFRHDQSAAEDRSVVEKKITDTVKKKPEVTLEAAQKSTVEIQQKIAARQKNTQPQFEPVEQMIKVTESESQEKQFFDYPPLDAYSQEYPLSQDDQPFHPSQPQTSDSQKAGSDRIQEKAVLSAHSLQHKPEKTLNNQEPDSISADTAGSRQLADEWHTLISQCGMSGLEQQLAKHCALESRIEENQQLVFNLLIQAMHKRLLNDKIQRRIQEHLQQQLGLSVILNIKECQYIQSELLTPQRREQLEAEARQQEAVNAILQDPQVMLLIDAFDAKVIEKSIKPA